MWVTHIATRYCHSSGLNRIIIWKGFVLAGKTRGLAPRGCFQPGTFCMMKVAEATDWLTFEFLSLVMLLFLCSFCFLFFVRQSQRINGQPPS
jgi:hypothetical protein